MKIWDIKFERGLIILSSGDLTSQKAISNLRESVDDFYSKAWCEGYKQGRSDEYNDQLDNIVVNADRNHRNSYKYKNCPYCHGRQDLVPINGDSHRHVAIVEDKNGEYAEVVYAKNGHVELSFNITCCPMCGRNLLI